MKIIRPLISLALLILLLVTAYGIVITWRHDPLAGLEKKPAKAKQAPPRTAPASIRFNPVPPPVLPDLTTGYVFNESRSAGTKKEEELVGKKTVGINIKESFYVGSIVVGDMPKGMIAYSEAGGAMPGRLPMGQGVSRVGGSNMKQMLVETGDNLGGYTVSEILPEKIVFTKDSETLEKFLKDPDKKRTIPVQLPSSGRQVNSSKVRTVGGGAPSSQSIRNPMQSSPAQTQPRNTPTRIVSPAGRSRPATSPAPAPAQQAPPVSSRQMTPEEIREMEQEIEKMEQK